MQSLKQVRERDLNLKKKPKSCFAVLKKKLTNIALKKSKKILRKPRQSGKDP